MRICLGVLATAAVLFAAGAAGALGTWAPVSATVIGLIGAVATVILMEDREFSRAVVTSLADRRHPLRATELLDATVELGDSA